MTNRVHEYSETHLPVGGHPASTESYDGTLRFVHIVNSDVEVQLLWVLRIRPSGRDPLRCSLKCQLTRAGLETDDHPVAKVFVDSHP
jgi:hypothetical protein